MPIIRYDNKLNLQTEFSDWNDLRINSTELIELASKAQELGSYYQVSHLGHLALELIFKAVYANHNSNEHPWGHQLENIIIGEYLPHKCLFRDISLNTRVNESYLLIKMVWDMQCRYKRIDIDAHESLRRLNAYQEIFKWVHNNYF